MKSGEAERVGAENDRLEAAAAWISRINSGHVTTRMLTELRNWMNESPENRAAFRQMEHLWSKLALVRHAVRQIYKENNNNEH